VFKAGWLTTLPLFVLVTILLNGLTSLSAAPSKVPDLLFVFAP
jgi:hypothetical protein